MNVVLMAGGEGTRLQPLTQRCPKPLLPVANRPLVEHLLRHLRRHGYRQATLTLCYRADDIRRALGGGERFGLRLDYSLEATALGTAGGVTRAVRAGARTLVVSGDIVTDLDLAALAVAHRRLGGAATIAVAAVTEPAGLGLVRFGPDGRVQDFVEKPPLCPEGPQWVNTGVYIIEPEVWDAVVRDHPCDFGRHLLPWLVHSGRPVYAQPAAGYWRDAGTPERFLAANLDVAAGRVRWRPAGGRQEGAFWVDQPIDLDPGAVVGPGCVLGHDASVGAGARLSRTVVGPWSSIGEGATLAESVLLPGARVPPGACLHRCLVTGETVIPIAAEAAPVLPASR